MMDSKQADLIAQFTAITGANPSMAQSALEATNWNLEQSMALFYDEQGEAPDGDADEEIDKVAPSTSSQSAPAQPVASASASSSGRNRQAGRPKQMTFQDLQRGDDEDDDDEDDGKAQDMFAGGEKSGLAVQNPDNAGGPPDHFRNIMNQARSGRARPPAHGHDEEEAVQPRQSNFTGRAQTLGGDDAESQVIEDPTATDRRLRPRREAIRRTLHLWRDGISIDDGRLYRFDDPANASIMQEINQGRAPRALLDVEVDQEVDLTLEPHKDEDYVQPKKKYKPFSGAGQRLGSPTPGLASSTSSSSAAAQAPSSSSAGKVPSNAVGASPSSSISVDESQPTLQMQIRLADGTRLSSRFNGTHTIGDVYEFVNRSSTASQRPYVLQTTFPTTEYSDQAKILSEISEFKRGGVLVQKFR